MNKKSLVWRDPDEGDRSRPSEDAAPRQEAEETRPQEATERPRRATRAAAPEASSSLPPQETPQPTPSQELQRPAVPRPREGDRPPPRGEYRDEVGPPRPSRPVEGQRPYGRPAEGPRGYDSNRGYPPESQRGYGSGEHRGYGEGQRPYGVRPPENRRPYEDDRGRGYGDRPPPRYNDSYGGPPPRSNRGYQPHEPYDSRRPLQDRPPDRYDRGGPPPRDRYDRPYDRQEPPPQRNYDRGPGGPPRPNDRYGPPPQDRYRQDDRYGPPRPQGGPPRPGGPPPGRGGPPRGRFDDRGRPPARPNRPPQRPSSKGDTVKDKLHNDAIAFAQQFNIPDAVAFQIVRGDFTLKEWLERHSEAERKREERGKVMAVKKQQRGRDEGMAQQYFLKQKKNATPLIFRMYEDQKSDGIIISILPYHFWVERVGANGETEREKLEKLRVLYCLKIDNEAEVDAVVTRDAKVTSLEIQPQREKEGRYQVPLDVIQKAADEGRPIQVTLNEGSVFRGTIDWHSTYFIKMKVAPNASIVVFNHSLHEVRDVSPEPAASGRKSARR